MERNAQGNAKVAATKCAAQVLSDLLWEEERLMIHDLDPNTLKISDTQNLMCNGHVLGYADEMSTPVLIPDVLFNCNFN